jgi:pimeloyl-ACP methyl ester carboxylesterase
MLVEQLSPHFYRFFTSQFGGSPEADDMLQELWLRIHRVRHTYVIGASGTGKSTLLLQAAARLPNETVRRKRDRAARSVGQRARRPELRSNANETRLRRLSPRSPEPEYGDRERDGDIVEAYSAMLHDRDPDVRRRAAVAWCTWESATPDWPPNPTRLAKRYEDPDFALAFARLVTHYVRHDDFLEDGILLRDAHLLVDIPGVLVNGRFDLQAPVANAWELARAWPQAELVIVDDAGHAADEPAMTDALIRASDRFARR